MTNHPLTEQQCELLSRQPWLDPEVDVEATIHDMRASADWQLEQVKKSVDRKIENYRVIGYTSEADIIEYFFEDVMRAMRPEHGTITSSQQEDQ